MDTMQDAVGIRLKQLREQRGMSLRHLVQVAGVSASSLSAVERGARAGERFSISTGRKLAQALGVTLDALAQTDEARAAAHTVAEAPPTAAAHTPTPTTAAPALAPGRGIATMPPVPTPREGTWQLGPLCVRGHADGGTGHTRYLFHGGTFVCRSSRKLHFL